MIADPIIAGIDVSKDRLDVCIVPQEAHFSVPNTDRAVAALARRLLALKVERVALEASGGYERKAAEGLEAAGLTVHLLAPQRVRALARALGRNAKTDPIDAAMIACFARLNPDLPVQRRDPVVDRLNELAGLRRQCVRERSTIACQLALSRDALVRRLLERALKRCKADIILLDAEIKRHIAATRLAQLYRQLIAIAGVGPVLAATLLCDLPELGLASPKQIASLVGVAPHARQSGKTRKAGRCFGGRSSVRNVLYMATLSALKARMPHLHPFYERLRANGKPFKLAITATMRKFITIINAIVRTNAKNATQSTVA